MRMEIYIESLNDYSWIEMSEGWCLSKLGIVLMVLNFLKVVFIKIV